MRAASVAPVSSGLVLLASLLAASAAPGAAQAFTGTFLVPDDAGGTTMVLTQTGAAVRGTLTGDGLSFDVAGRIEDETLTGRISGPAGSFYFTAERWEDELWLEVYGTDASGQPDYDEWQEIDFVLADEAGPAPSDAGGARAGAAPAAPTAPSARGPAGAEAPAGRTATGRELAPGFTEDHAMVREWVAFLSGKKLTRMSSYSSGSAGGYSARTDLYLCSDRSWALRDESSVSVDVGGAFGNAGGVESASGRWYVITNGQATGLVLEAVTGEVTELRLDYQNEQTFANGERVFVTPAEVCG